LLGSAEIALPAISAMLSQNVALALDSQRRPTVIQFFHPLIELTADYRISAATG